VSEEAQIIRFPVERRRATKLLEGAHVTVVHGDGGTMRVTSTSGVVGVAGNGSAAPVAPAWWGRLPAPEEHEGYDDRAMWMKLGATPATRAKRHRVIFYQPHVTNGEPHLVAVAACGRRVELSPLFDDAWSGGDCGVCRQRGWR
jgi:hypothetical protein